MESDKHDRGLCSECGVKRGFYQKQIRRLREKLEYSDLHVQKLLLQCAQLRDELNAAKLQAASSLIPRRKSPTLPNELLREIFAIATRINDLAFSPWNAETRGRSWTQSSITRRSIPLVCRQWNAVGTEFLYEHLVLSGPSQIVQLIDLLEGISIERRENYLSWIRGLELTLGPATKRGAINYWREARNLAGLLPLNRLKIFGMDALEYVDSEVVISAEATAKFAFQYFKNNLEILHIPIINHSLDWDFFSQIDIESREVGSLTPVYFPRLHTLSTTSGRWDLRPPKSARGAPLRVLKGHFPALRSLSLDWTEDDDDIIQFIGAIPQLERVHVGDERNHCLISTALDAFLYAVPRLKQLTVTTSDRNIRSPFLNKNYLLHRELEEITLLMNYAVSYKVINALFGIFEKVESGNLPGLRKITLFGPFLGGCLDGALVFPAQQFRNWKKVIDLCARRGVELANTQGELIHLWSVRHGIDAHFESRSSESHANADENTPNDSNETNDKEESSEEDDQWYEEEASGYSRSTSDDDEISNDSEDRAYRYVSQPDLGYRSDTSLDSGVSSE